jgi:hypothetical protein
MGKTTGIKNQHGSSLIEVLVGGMIFVVCITGFFSSFSQLSRMGRENVLHKRAYQELEKVLENPIYSWGEYTRLPQTDSTLIDDSTIVLQERNGKEPVKGRVWLKLYKVSYATVDINKIPAKKLQGVLLTEDENGKAFSCSLETLLTLNFGEK